MSIINLPIQLIRKPFLLKNQQSEGFAMIEVLVSVILMAIGMIGLAGMLMMSQKTSSSSYLKQQAVDSAYDMVDRVRANSAAAISGAYAIDNLPTSGAPVIPDSPATNCVSTVCTATQLASYDTWSWASKELTKLPNGSGSIVVSNVAGSTNTLLTITVQWDDSAAQKTIGAANKTGSINPALAQLIVQTML
jgi:type IV pilus assembly protein PilV